MNSPTNWVINAGSQYQYTYFEWIHIGAANPPAVAVWPPNSDETAGQQDVFWKGNGNNNLFEAVWNNGWSGWRQVPVGIGHVGSAPTVAINVTRHEEDIFFKDAQTGSLYEVIWQSQQHQWHDLGVVPNTGVLG